MLRLSSASGLFGVGLTFGRALPVRRRRAPPGPTPTAEPVYHRVGQHHDGLGYRERPADLQLSIVQQSGATNTATLTNTATRQPPGHGTTTQAG